LTKLQELNTTMSQLASLKQDWIPGSQSDPEQELDRLEKSLQIISKELKAHLTFEEKRFLPILASYAALIIRNGVLFEHERLLDSINSLRKSARRMVGRPSSREELLSRQSVIRESITSILQSVGEHAQTQGMIFRLAKDALASELQASTDTALPYKQKV
jgi:hypothetical protein